MYLQKEEIVLDGVWTEPQREILRDIYARTVHMSKTGLPHPKIRYVYQFYDIKKKNI